MIPMESGPNSPWIPPGLPAEMFGYGPGRWQPVQTACSLYATLGVNATAMGALDILKSGGHPGYVLSDLRGTLQNPQRVVLSSY